MSREHNKRIGRSFFDRDTVAVARELLGKTIVRTFDDGSRIEAIIVETEAYHGFDDRASHASRRKTERNKIMFDKPGLIYVYLVYGMHYCLNFVTMEEGFPAAVLVRAVMISSQSEIYNLKSTITSGPGRVCKALQIDKSFYGEDTAKSARLWAEGGGLVVREGDILAGKRVGVEYAGESADLSWNFKLQSSNVKQSSKHK